MNEKDGVTSAARTISIGSKSFKLPANRGLRICIGVLLVVLGFLGWLPFVGFWMVPLGIFVLSIDLHWARRLRRRSAVWFTRRFPKWAGKANGTSQSSLPDGGESG